MGSPPHFVEQLEGQQSRSKPCSSPEVGFRVPLKLGLYEENGKENGNYYNGSYRV